MFCKILIIECNETEYSILLQKFSLKIFLVTNSLRFFIRKFWISMEIIKTYLLFKVKY